MHYSCPLPDDLIVLRKKIRAYEDLTGRVPVVRIRNVTMQTDGGELVFLQCSSARVTAVGNRWLTIELNDGEICKARPLERDGLTNTALVRFTDE